MSISSLRLSISPRWTLGFVLAAFFLVPGRAFASRGDILMADDADASIQLWSAGNLWDGLGWMPVTVRIENRSAKARVWEVVFDAGAPYGGGLKLSAPFVFAVPAGTTRETVVFVPGPGIDSRSVTAQLRAGVSGPGVNHPGGVSLLGTRQRDFTQVVVSPGQESALRNRLPAAPPSGGSAPFELETIDPAHWPADWRVWSPFADVVLGRDEFEALDGARRGALREWVAQGGRLWLSPGRSATPPVPAERIGMGRIEFRTVPLPALKTEAHDGALRGVPWAGLATLISDDDHEAWKLERGTVWLIVFLVVFGVVVGPVNLFVLAPASRRHRLFLTVPAISLGATLMLGGVILWVDGIGGSGVRRALVVLLPGEPKAVVFQQQVARTGVLLGKAFPVPADTLLAAEPGTMTGPRQVRVLGRAGDQAEGDWFTSRAVRGHNLWRITPTRARVERVDNGGGNAPPVVQSSVTTVLRDFAYRDTAGRWWGAKELPPGRRTTLEPVAGPPGWVPGNGGGQAAAGTFYAHGGASDLAPLATHPGIRWGDETVFYTGRVEAAHAP